MNIECRRNVFCLYINRLSEARCTIRHSSIVICHSSFNLVSHFHKLQYGVNLILTALNFNERGITA